MLDASALKTLLKRWFSHRDSQCWMKFMINFKPWNWAMKLLLKLRWDHKLSDYLDISNEFNRVRQKTLLTFFSTFPWNFICFMSFFSLSENLVSWSELVPLKNPASAILNRNYLPSKTNKGFRGKRRVVKAVMRHHRGECVSIAASSRVSHERSIATASLLQFHVTKTD